MKILAFPGMGKTPLALKSGKYLDLDFGHFREAFGLNKASEEKLLKPYVSLMERFEQDGFVVLSNEPSTLALTEFDKMYLPVDESYSAKKLGVDLETVRSWISEWEASAIQHKIPVIWVEKGLDRYLPAFSRMSERRERSCKRSQYHAQKKS